MPPHLARKLLQSSSNPPTKSRDHELMKPQKRVAEVCVGRSTVYTISLFLLWPLFLYNCCSDLSCLIFLKFHLCLSWWLFNGAVYFLYAWSIFVPEHNNADECTWPYLSAHCSVSLCLVSPLSRSSTCYLGHVYTNVNEFENVVYTLKFFTSTPAFLVWKICYWPWNTKRKETLLNLCFFSITAIV